NFTPLDIRQAARSAVVGEDALQFAGAGRPLVPGRKRGESRATGFEKRASTQSVCRKDSGHFGGSAPVVLRKTGEAVERKLMQAGWATGPSLKPAVRASLP